MSTISSFLREQRHIFGTCPHCRSLFRLVDAKVSYDSPYKVDWLDKLENLQESWETKAEELGEKEKAMRREAIEKATRTELPKLLHRIVPTFTKSNLNPQDIKTLFHPIDFLVFDGLNNDRVDRVLLMDHKPNDSGRTSIHKGINDAIRSEAIEWRTLRVSETGEITSE